MSLAIPVWAESFFGPKTFTAAAGKPQTFTETIAVDSGAACEGKAVFTLLVQNDGVASAVVTLNGVAVLTESDFPRVPAEVPVRLGASNVLGVQLNGGTAGGTLTLAIRRDIETPLASPVTHTLTGKSGTFTTTANVSDTSGPFILEVVSGGATGSIRINGAVVVTDNELTKTATLLRKSVTLQAANTIVTELKGTAGELVTIALRRRVDASACSGIIVNFTAPAALAMVNAHTIVVTGTTTGTREVGVTVNSFPADIDLEHAGTAADPFRWAANVSAEPGTVTLTAVASSGGA
ncbi:MAG TPA: hypothetical protein VF698_19920, partial [Thermoanaerobaculia bacterium]